MTVGNSIAQLQEITEVLSDDTFVIAEKDIYDAKAFNSKYVEAGDIMECGVSAGYRLLMEHFGTMVLQSSADYSLSSHSHGEKYTFIDRHDIRANYGPASVECLSIGNFFLDGEISAVWCPTQFAKDADQITIETTSVEPKIGEIRFFTQPVSLDGWVPPNGSIYDADAYEHAQTLLSYYGIAGSRQFRVPDLAGFFRINNNTDPTCRGGDSWRHVQYHVYTPQHSDHSIALTMSGTLSVFATISCSSAAGDGQYAHNGVQRGKNNENNKTITGGDYSVFISPNIQVAGLTIGGASDGTEPCPAHMVFPAYVYIGRKA